MEVRRRPPNSTSFAGELLHRPPHLLTNAVFLALLFFLSFFVLHKVRHYCSSPLPEIAAVFTTVASVLYLLGFFGIDCVHSFLASRSAGWGLQLMREPKCTSPSRKLVRFRDDDAIVRSVVSGSIPSHSLESVLGDCKRAVKIRRAAVRQITGRLLDGLPVEGMDYDSLLGQCCELPVGYVQIPVGVAGPLLLDGKEHWVPMATTEGCLVASTNRGCKAIHASGGATSVVLKDGITRAPVFRFPSAAGAARLKLFLEDPRNFDKLSLVFNRPSEFARLQSVKCSVAGRNLYARFSCSSGDAMGMNMVSKGVQNVLDFLRKEFPDMHVLGISGNLCSDKKAAAINWVEGRGKSVVCEAVIKEQVVREVLKTTVPTLLELNVVKNLAGSAMAGALGGFNAHASNVVSAIYIATGQDPAQNVESSHCITMMEAVNHGKDLHVSVTMPSIEVGTIGGGTQLASQSACLNLLGVKGPSRDCPGSHSRQLASVVAASVLAGEVSLMAAIAAGQLVSSHMKYNRSGKDVIGNVHALRRAQ